MRSEYDFQNGQRGKYSRRYENGTNLVLVDPDLAKIFPTQDSVNAALRTIAEAAARLKSS